MLKLQPTSHLQSVGDSDIATEEEKPSTTHALALGAWARLVLRLSGSGLIGDLVGLHRRDAGRIPGDGVGDNADVEPNRNYYCYVDWTAADAAAGTTSGTITLPGNPVPVGVELRVLNPDGSHGSLYFGQASGGTNYWAATR